MFKKNTRDVVFKFCCYTRSACDSVPRPERTRYAFYTENESRPCAIEQLRHYPLLREEDETRK